MDLFWVIWATVFSALVGSFLGCMFYRIPLKENIYRSSFCPECHERIPAYLNIPIVSWLGLAGYSKCCGNKISFNYFLSEALYAGWGFFLAYIISPFLVIGIGVAIVFLSIIISWITRKSSPWSDIKEAKELDLMNQQGTE